MRRAFSLVELIIVVVVISILAGIAVPQYRNAKQKYIVKGAMGVAESIRVALKMYSADQVAISELPFIFPHKGSLPNLDAVYSALSPYLVENPASHLGGGGLFIYDTSCDPNASVCTAYSGIAGSDRMHYTFTVRAKDQNQTVITATRDKLWADYQGEALSFP